MCALPVAGHRGHGAEGSFCNRHGLDPAEAPHHADLAITRNVGRASGIAVARSYCGRLTHLTGARITSRDRPRPRPARKYPPLPPNLVVDVGGLEPGSSGGSVDEHACTCRDRPAAAARPVACRASDPAGWRSGRRRAGMIGAAGPRGDVCAGPGRMSRLERADCLARGRPFDADDVRVARCGLTRAAAVGLSGS